MPDTPCEKSLERVLIYLKLDGHELTNDLCRKVLKLVDEASAAGDGKDLAGRCVELIPDYFDCRAARIPPQAPLMRRGHLGYFPHD